MVFYLRMPYKFVEFILFNCAQNTIHPPPPKHTPLQKNTGEPHNHSTPERNVLFLQSLDEFEIIMIVGKVSWGSTADFLQSAVFKHWVSCVYKTWTLCVYKAIFRPICLWTHFLPPPHSIPKLHLELGSETLKPPLEHRDGTLNPPLKLRRSSTLPPFTTVVWCWPESAFHQTLNEMVRKELGHAPPHLHALFYSYHREPHVRHALRTPSGRVLAVGWCIAAALIGV